MLTTISDPGRFFWRMKKNLLDAPTWGQVKGVEGDTIWRTQVGGTGWKHC
jgi:hypothetical protein